MVYSPSRLSSAITFVVVVVLFPLLLDELVVEELLVGELPLPLLGGGGSLLPGPPAIADAAARLRIATRVMALSGFFMGYFSFACAFAHAGSYPRRHKLPVDYVRQNTGTVVIDGKGRKLENIQPPALIWFEW